MISSGTTRYGRAAVWSACLLLAATGCASAGTGATTSSSAGPSASTTVGLASNTQTSAAEPGRCHSDQLTAAYKPLPGAATGRTYADIVLTNHSGRTCWVIGSVTVKMMDANHHPIPVPVQVFPGNTGQVPGPAARVVLEPDGSAAETLQYGSDGNPPPGKTVCEPTEAYLAITAPGEAEVTTLPYPARGSNSGYCPHDEITLTNLVAGPYSAPF